MAHAYIGCSGFFYPEWSGPFYPPFLSQRQWFAYYAERLQSLEVSATFYRMPSKELFDRWHKETPPGYIFTLKGPRFITHVKKLKDVDSPLEAFFNAAMPLQNKLRVVLWQFPPTFKADLGKLQTFFEALQPYPVRHAFEFRHESWGTEACAALCKEYRMALCLANNPEFATGLPVTTDFVYIRRHGPGGLYSGAYDKEALERDAAQVADYLARDLDVFFYFNNHTEGHAPKDAMTFRGLVENMGKKG